MKEYLKKYGSFVSNAIMVGAGGAALGGAPFWAVGVILACSAISSVGQVWAEISIEKDDTQKEATEFLMASPQDIKGSVEKLHAERKSAIKLAERFNYAAAVFNPTSLGAGAAYVWSKYNELVKASSDSQPSAEELTKLVANYAPWLLTTAAVSALLTQCASYRKDKLQAIKDSYIGEWRRPTIPPMQSLPPPRPLSPGSAP